MVFNKEVVMAGETPTTSTSVLSGLRTHLMGAGIVVHQVGKLFGVDIPDDIYSASIDIVLAIGVIYFRMKAKSTPVKAVEGNVKEDSNVC